MSQDPTLPDRGEIVAILDLVRREAERFYDGLDERPVRHPNADQTAYAFAGALPEHGNGAAAALRELTERGADALIQSAGPRCFHFVMGGGTPAAVGADMLAAVYDQMVADWLTAPLATQLEITSLAWLRALLGLPDAWSGVMTTGAMMANYTCLAAARQWWGAEHGVDVAEDGLAGLGPVPVFSSGHVHASSVKALAMLGIGRRQIRRFARDPAGRLDRAALEQALRALDGAPAILIANAGEVNTGDFDPIQEMADLAERYRAWLHVDGAFGLFARVSPRTAALAAGVERARSATVDGHKWLNVPYDCGFAFVENASYLAPTFRLAADYLRNPDDPQPKLANLVPESSRRARALAVWTTLRAYGRSGYRAIIERHLDLAQHLARRVDEASELERLADVKLNIVCFRVRPPGLPEAEVDALNQRVGAALLEEGLVFAGTTRYEGKVALRPALVNWRTRASDLDLLVERVRALASRLA